MLLNLNPVMSIIANVPAAIASTVRIYIFVYSWRLHENLKQIVAGRVVRRLNNFTSTGAEMYPCVYKGTCSVLYLLTLLQNDTRFDRCFPLWYIWLSGQDVFNPP